jgi:hypothetical protein
MRIVNGSRKRSWICLIRGTEFTARRRAGRLMTGAADG